jgi:hypothetical protein
VLLLVLSLCSATVDWRDPPEPPPVHHSEQLDYGAGIGATVGAALGGVVGVGAAWVGLLLAFGGSSSPLAVVPMFVGFAAVPIAPVVGAAIGADSAGESESRLLAGAIGGAAGVGVVAVGYAAASGMSGALVPNASSSTRSAVFATTLVVGVVVALASCGAVTVTSTALLD